MVNCLGYSKPTLLISLLVFGLSSCALSNKRDSYPVATQQQIVWPEKPAKPRIKYIGSFSSAADLGIEKGFFTLLAEFFIGAKEQHLVRPMAVVSTTEKEIFVADPGINGVHYFNLESQNYKQIRLSGDFPLPSPTALTVDEQQHVLVSDSALGKVFRINLEAGIAEPILLQAKLQQPTGLAYDKTRKHLYVVDTAKHQILVFDSQGSLRKTIGQRGTGKAEFNYPTYIWFDTQGTLWVTDSLNYRVQYLSAGGKYLGEFGEVGQVSGSFSRPKGVATDEFGHIYSVDALFHAVQIFDKNGRLLLNLGQQGQKPGEFWLPTGIYIGNNNRVYIADSYNMRIQVFQYIGDGT